VRNLSRCDGCFEHIFWAPLLQVDYEDQSSFLWYFNYPLEEGEGFLTVATAQAFQRARGSSPKAAETPNIFMADYIWMTYQPHGMGGKRIKSIQKRGERMQRGALI
jgi:hypothetical protein